MILVKGQVKQLPRYGENIYRRKDGRWEGRYIAMRLPDGRAKYKSVYGKTHDIVKKKQMAAIQALAKEPAAACDLTVKELFARYLAQADVKPSTRATDTLHDRTAHSSAAWADACFKVDGERTF